MLDDMWGFKVNDMNIATPPSQSYEDKIKQGIPVH